MHTLHLIQFLNSSTSRLNVRTIACKHLVAEGSKSFSKSKLKNPQENELLLTIPHISLIYTIGNLRLSFCYLNDLTASLEAFYYLKGFRKNSDLPLLANVDLASHNLRCTFHHILLCKS